MSGDTPFEPRLGRIRDRGQRGAGRFGKAIRKRVARLSRKASNRRIRKSRSVRGAQAASVSRMRGTPYPAFRMRRVVVKVHIARAGRLGGAKAFAEHVGYIERDGAGRDGERGQAYDRDAEDLDTRAFRERSAGDERQFRLIVSAEDADRLEDLKPEIRAFMAGVEEDLGTKLDWIAVDHHDTGQPHTHIVIRGRDATGDHLVIDRNYLMRGLRERASRQLTERLGPRRDLEILRQHARDVTADRMTGLDRAIEKDMRDDRISLGESASERSRFDRSQRIKRLRHLERLGLATRDGNSWHLKPGWTETLKQLGRKGDIIRSMTARYRSLDVANRLELLDETRLAGTTLSGRIAGTVILDEMRDRHALILERTDGKVSLVPLASGQSPADIPEGAIADIRFTQAKARRSDHTIAHIASLSDGIWSEDRHASLDPESSPAYRLAHKRRLEALRRAGIVQRLASGDWKIGEDYLARAAAYEQARGGARDIFLRSRAGPDALVEADALTWLDEVDPERLAETGFGGEVRRARLERMTVLRSRGLLAEQETALSAQAREQLKANELAGLAAAEARASGRTFQALEHGGTFSGRFEKIIDTHQGRMALVGQEGAFTLVRMRTGMGAGLGRDISLTRKSTGIDWMMGRERGPSR